MAIIDEEEEQIQ